MVESKRAKVFGDGVEVTVRKDKQPYLAPTLRIYGSVAQFTMGGHSCETDQDGTFTHDNSCKQNP